MKRTKIELFFMAILMLALSNACSPLMKNVVAFNSSGTSQLSGEWEYEYDVLGFHRFTWTSSLNLNHAEMIVELSFDDWSLNDVSTLAFKLYSEKYEYDWLYITKQGEPIPDLTYFNEIGFIEDYPGGYEEFEKELLAKDINWVTLYEKLRAEWLIMYITLDTTPQNDHEPIPCENCLDA